MSGRYVRLDPAAQDDLGAAVISGTLAVGVGLVAFYLARLFLSREVVDEAVDRELLASPQSEE